MPPTWRPDVAIEEDLIEEIGRFRGYNDVPSRLPGEPPRVGDRGAPTRLAAFVRSVLAARGYVEAMTYKGTMEFYADYFVANNPEIETFTIGIKKSGEGHYEKL